MTINWIIKSLEYEQRFFDNRIYFLKIRLTIASKMIQKTWQAYNYMHFKVIFYFIPNQLVNSY